MATGFATVALILLAWQRRKDFQAIGYSTIAVTEALNDGCMRALAGYGKETLEYNV